MVCVIIYIIHKWIYSIKILRICRSSKLLILKKSFTFLRKVILLNKQMFLSKPTKKHSRLYCKIWLFSTLRTMHSMCCASKPIICGGFDQHLCAEGGSKSPDSVKSIAAEKSFVKIKKYLRGILKQASCKHNPGN